MSTHTTLGAPGGTAYLKVHGRLFRVMAITTTAEEANDYMLRNPGAALLAIVANLHYLADVNDKGEPHART